MDCPRAQLLLLQSDDPRPAHAVSGELASHLRRCVACRRLAGRIAQVEETYRAAPEPARVEPARKAFMKQLERHPSIAARRAARFWRTVSIRWAAAAVVFLAVGMGALLLVPPTPVQAAPDVVERLVDWNLAIAQAATPEERQRIHQNRAPRLERSVQTANLTPEERQLATRLLESGGLLMHEQDLLREADQLTEMTDLLVDQLQRAADQGDEARINQLAKQVQQVNERGLAPRLERAFHGPGQERVKALLDRETRRVARLENLMGKAPKAAQKEMKKVIDKSKKQQKVRRRAKA